MERCVNSLNMLSCNRKLRYRCRNYEIYKMHSDDTSYRQELKLQLKETSEKISFFQPNNRCFDVVIAGDSIDEVSTTITHPPSCIKSAAATL